MEPAIRNDLPAAYGLNLLTAEPVDGGWLNRKWKAVTDCGMFLVKQFSRIRFDDCQLRYIADALVRQRFAGEHGIPCPAVLPANGQPLRYLNDGTVYMVMTFCEGHIETPQTITDKQIHDLGYTLGCLHRLFGTLPLDNRVKGYPVDSTQMLGDLRNYCRTIPSGQRFTEIADALSAEWLERLPKGIAHEDFSPDNLLFHENRVAAVLDFDRSCYSFLYHDIGRALMSLAWNDGVLRYTKIRAFADGYSTANFPLSHKSLADALRLTWFIETPWWIRPEFSGECPPKVARFRDEILWLTENFEKLEKCIG